MIFQNPLTALNPVFTVGEQIAMVLRKHAGMNNKQAKALKRIAGDSFKLLLTGTPIEKNIMDLYGLIWFIDETLLPGEKEFLARYLRRPENYPELSEQVSRYCFRTLRSQAKHYAKVTERVLLTVEYTPGRQSGSSMSCCTLHQPDGKESLSRNEPI